MANGLSARPGSVPAPIRNAYTARWLARRALLEIDSRRVRLGNEMVAAWSADVAVKGSIDVPAAARTGNSWKSRDDQLAAQQQALANLSKMLDHAIEGFKKSDPAGVFAVLKERIAAIQAGHDRSEREESERQSELQRLLEELNAIDPEQPAHAKEGRRPGSKQV